MKKSVLLLSIVLLAFSASAQAYYVGTGLIGAPMGMLLLPGCNPGLIAAANPSLLPILMGGPCPIVTLHTMPNLCMIPNLGVTLPLMSPFVQPGSSVLVIGVQSSTTPSTQDMVMSIITSMTD